MSTIGPSSASVPAVPNVIETSPGRRTVTSSAPTPVVTAGKTTPSVILEPSD